MGVVWNVIYLVINVQERHVVAVKEAALGESGLYAKYVSDLREGVLTNAEVAEITGVKTRQVQHWASGAHRPQGEAKERLLELHYIVEQLRDVYTPEGVDIWIHGRNRSLGAQRPIDMLAEGRFKEVLAAVERLASGAM